ncbi:MAG TPA: ergothioneine biosynthesis protein EgtB [Acidimicrobiales bacterium]|nr:ergothioneine biosynthesis protein EgtB [Acidimicrobiales bacterium]
MTTTTASPRADVTTRYPAVRAVTETLADPLSPEDQVIQSMPDASPTKWHRAHTTWFFETFLLKPHLAGYEVFEPMFEYLFNSYYEAVGERHARNERGLVSRPSAADVSYYRQHVDAAMGRLLDDIDEDDGRRHLIELGLHHEQQHQELLLMDIKHAFWVNPMRPAYRPRAANSAPSASPHQWIEHDGGEVEIGHVGDGFSFDNEGPRHGRLLPPFRIADRLVTAGEWKTFIADGGYERPEFWLSDGWAWVQSNRIAAPAYWSLGDGDWSVHTLHGTHAVGDAEPVCHVSHYEADAYASWAGARLPTEFEWEVAVAADRTPGRDFDLDGLHPRAGGLGGSLSQGFGEVWQWTASPYVGYPGFAPAAGAVGEYNGKFMSNQMVLRGSSCATPAGHARPTYRNFFPAAARWAFSGLRLALDA